LARFKIVHHRSLTSSETLFKPKIYGRISRVLVLILIVLGSVSMILPGAFAWGVSASPGTRNVVPGGTTSFTVSVTGSIPGDPNVNLLVSPPTLGISPSFTVNNVPAPFVSTLVVSVDASKPPGTYEIPIWANPAGTPFPGPGNEATKVFVIVGGAFDFSLTLSPPSLTVEQGQTARYQIFITYSDPAYSGTTINVQVLGTGPGMNYQLIPSPAGLNILTSTATPPGTYTIALRGSAMGVTHQTSALLTVTAKQPPFDFAIEATPGSQSVKAGRSISFNVNIRLVSGTAQLVTLSLTGNPIDTTYSFSPNSGYPSFSSNLGISTGSSAPPGTYSLQITGQAGSVTHSTTVQLVIEKATSPSSIFLSVNPTTITMGDAISVSGVLSPGVGTTVDIIYRRSDGIELTRHVATSASGAFSDSFTPDMEGPWSIFARWGGNDDLEGSESPPASFVVEAAPPPPPPPFWEQIPGGLTTLIIAAIAIIAIIAVAATRRGHKADNISRQPMAAATRRCSKCGAEVSMSSAFCPSCGEKLQ